MTTIYERPFTNEVIRLARDHNWVVFHIHDQDSYDNYRKLATGGGFPDLIMYRLVEDKTSMIVAELKTDAPSSVVRPNQDEWLRAYKQFIPTFAWRPSDWEEIERVLTESPQAEEGKRKESVSTAEEKSLPDYLRTIVNGLRSEIREQEFPRGDHAQLRRMDPSDPGPAVFWRLYAGRNLSQVGGADSEKKWATIIQGIALLSEHDRGSQKRFGRALFEGDDPIRLKPFYSERRLDQLLVARGQTLRILLRRAFRMLVDTGQCIYWLQVAELILNDGYDETEADRARNAIASDYYRSLAIAQRRSTQTTNQEV